MGHRDQRHHRNVGAGQPGIQRQQTRDPASNKVAIEAQHLSMPTLMHKQAQVYTRRKLTVSEQRQRTKIRMLNILHRECENNKYIL